MKVLEKINLSKSELIKHGPINIVAFGDSVTHGALASGEVEFETAYWNRLGKMIHKVRNYMPINMINAGIGGATAKDSLARMDSQVFAHNPDLIIICFGLNDVNRELEDYLGALKVMFERCREKQIDTIFMTPNMMNTYVADDAPKEHWKYAHQTAEMQNSGKVDTYIYGAKALAESMGITVCDCYSHWKELAKTKDTTMMLANRINHPTAEMHALFAEKLFKCIFAEEPKIVAEQSSTMWKN